MCYADQYLEFAVPAYDYHAWRSCYYIKDTGLPFWILTELIFKGRVL